MSFRRVESPCPIGMPVLTLNAAIDFRLWLPPVLAGDTVRSLTAESMALAS